MTEPSLQTKILLLPQLIEATRAARKEGKRIVQCHGCFDIVHPGHIRYLEFARRQGDILIVSLTGDSDIEKGDQRPYIPQELRAENLAALMFVDYVCIDTTPTAEVILEAIKPDVYVKGREYEQSNAPAFLAERHIVEHNGGTVIFSSGEIVFSSSELIERIPQSAGTHFHRLKLAAKRHGLSVERFDVMLDRFKDINVLIVGDIIIDRYVLCDTIGVASESPMMNLARRDERSYVGGAAIVARHVKALGADAFLLSGTGPKDQLRQVSNVLASEGVATHFIESRPSLVEKTRFLVEDTKLFKVEDGAHAPLDSIAERQAAAVLEQQSKRADLVIFCDFGFGAITQGLLTRVLPTLRQNVRIIAADVSGDRANMLAFHHVDLLCPTERELRSTLHDYDAGLSAVAWNVLEQTQARHLLVTLEKRGMVVFERRNQDRASPGWSGRLRSDALPSFADFARDRLGCGDALLSAAALSLATGSTLMEAAYLGNAAAAMEIAMLGNHPIDAKALRHWLHAREEISPPSVERTVDAASVPQTHSHSENQAIPQEYTKHEQV